VESKLQETQGDIRFVSEVRPTTKLAYVSIEELTKSQVSFNPNPPKLPPRPTRCSLSIPTMRRAIQTSRDSTTILGRSRVAPSCLGDWIPKSNKHNEVIEGEGWGALLESMAHSRDLKSSLKNKNQDLDLREREESSSFGSQGIFSSFWVAYDPRGSWGYIYSPYLKRAIGGIFHWTSLVVLSGSQCKSLKASLRPDLSDPPD
jgi:hypothetical protein